MQGWFWYRTLSSQNVLIVFKENAFQLKSMGIKQDKLWLDHANGISYSSKEWAIPCGGNNNRIKHKLSETLSSFWKSKCYLVIHSLSVCACVHVSDWWRSKQKLSEHKLHVIFLFLRNLILSHNKLI